MAHQAINMKNYLAMQLTQAAVMPALQADTYRIERWKFLKGKMALGNEG